MMTATMTETSPLNKSLIYRPSIECFQLCYCRLSYSSMHYVTFMVYVNNPLLLYCQETCKQMCKQHNERKAGVQEYTWPPSEDLNANYASEGLYPSKAINSNAFRPRIFKQNVYITSIPNTCILCIRFKDTVVACIITINMHELITQQSPNGTKKNSLPNTRHDALDYRTLIKLRPNLEYALKAYFLTKRVFKSQLFPWRKYVLPSQPPILSHHSHLHNHKGKWQEDPCLQDVV